MPHLIPFGCQIRGVVGVAGCDNRNLIDDLHIETAKVECFRLFRVVGKEPNLPQSKVLEDLKANPVVPHICFVSQSVVGVDGIHSFVLEFIGSDFFGESDPTTPHPSLRIISKAIRS